LFPVDCASAALPTARRIVQKPAKTRAGRLRVGMTELLIIVIFSEAFGTQHYDQRGRDPDAAIWGAILPSFAHGQ
jgi:hypothetical protein